MIPQNLEEIAALAIITIIPRIASVSSALVVLVVALALIFAGRFVIRVVAFFGVGVVFAAAAASVGAAILGIVGFVIGGAIGFLVGGFLSFVLLPLAIGVASGLVAYDLSSNICPRLHCLCNRWCCILHPRSCPLDEVAISCNRGIREFAPFPRARILPFSHLGCSSYFHPDGSVRFLDSGRL